MIPVTLSDESDSVEDNDDDDSNDNDDDNDDNNTLLSLCRLGCMWIPRGAK